MKNLFKSLFLTLAVAGGTLFTSCDNDSGNDILRQDPNTGKDSTNTVKNYAIKVTPTNGDTKEREVTIVAEPNKMVKVTTSFTGNKSMYRLYLTKNVYSEGKGAVAYQYELGVKKKDGSIDLQRGDKKEFTFVFDFDTPKKNNDIVEYQLWVTHGRGDFRDISKRNAIDATALGKVIIKSDKDANVKPVTLRNFSTVLLAAPTADEKSASFASILDGKTYKIKDGEEYGAYWDFGYYWGGRNNASFVSTYNYDNIVQVGGKPVLDIVTKTGITQDQLNHCYFKKSAKTVADFDAISKGSDLDFVTKSDAEIITKLTKGSIVEFVDNYGNKGLIKVTNVVTGAGSDGKIEFDIKVQVKSVPVKG